MQFPCTAARNAVTLALSEDAAAHDVTTRWSVGPRQWATAVIVTRQPGVAAGVPLAAEVYARIGGETQIDESVPDGTRLEAGDVLARISGPAHQLITGERTVLNFLQRLCGIATLTDRYVAGVRDLPVRVLDTRKTAPGLRLLDKYAVSAGGGHNHRLDLGAMVLLKENHIAAAGGVTAALDNVRQNMASEGKTMAIEVEVATIPQAREALQAEPSWIMLDNMTVPQTGRSRPSCRRNWRRLRRQAGGPGQHHLGRLGAVAETGVQAVSVSAATQAPADLDRACFEHHPILERPSRQPRSNRRLPASQLRRDCTIRHSGGACDGRPQGRSRPARAPDHPGDPPSGTVELELRIRSHNYSTNTGGSVPKGYWVSVYRTIADPGSCCLQQAGRSGRRCRGRADPPAAAGSSHTTLESPSAPS